MRIEATSFLVLLLTLLLGLGAHQPNAQAQATRGKEPRRVASATALRPSLFLSCADDCFDAYLRQELSYFDFSRDPYRADLTLVLVRQPAGSGGERFTATLVPATPVAPGAQPLLEPSSFTVPAGSPDHAKRRLLLQSLLRLLQRHVQGTKHGAHSNWCFLRATVSSSARWRILGTIGFSCPN